jgi:hypothetical protein
MLTWARVDHLGLHFRVGHTRTFLGLAGYPTGRPLRPWSRGFWWVFTFDKLSPYRDHSTSRGQGFGGNSPGRTLQETALVQIPGRVLPGSLRLERTGAGVLFDHIRWDLGGGQSSQLYSENSLATTQISKYKMSKLGELLG